MAKSRTVTRVTRVVVHKTKPNKEEKFRDMLHALVPAWKKQIPELSLTVYRSATAERGLFIAHVTIPLEHLPDFYEWSVIALEREWGKARTDRYLRDYYDCLQESKQLAVVYEDRPDR
jgi:hypothetical protein